MCIARHAQSTKNYKYAISQGKHEEWSWFFACRSTSKVSSFISGLSMNGMWSHSHVRTHASTYLSLLSSHMQNSIWRVNQVCSVTLLQIIHHVKLIFIPRNPLYCIIFGSKQISATDAQEHFSPADVKQRRR